MFQLVGHQSWETSNNTTVQEWENNTLFWGTWLIIFKRLFVFPQTTNNWILLWGFMKEDGKSKANISRLERPILDTVHPYTMVLGHRVNSSSTHIWTSQPQIDPDFPALFQSGLLFQEWLVLTWRMNNSISLNSTLWCSQRSERQTHQVFTIRCPSFPVHQQLWLEAQRGRMAPTQEKSHQAYGSGSCYYYVWPH